MEIVRQAIHVQSLPSAYLSCRISTYKSSVDNGEASMGRDQKRNVNIRSHLA